VKGVILRDITWSTNVAHAVRYEVTSRNGEMLRQAQSAHLQILRVVQPSGLRLTVSVLSAQEIAFDEDHCDQAL
jgi:hypothetical protein